MTATVGILCETRPGETRVALLPDHVKKLLGPVGDGPPAFACVVQTGAGLRAYADDAAYTASGAEVVQDARAVLDQADILAVVNPPDPALIESAKIGAILIGMLHPTTSLDLLRACAARPVTAIAFEALPRITRAQKADALSSMSTVAGYRAALRGAALFPGFFPMMMTPAGTITPARVLIIGAGVAGLQAIATARRLGAVVEAYDIRPVAKEQVQSLGARFVELADDAGEAETAGGYAKEQTAEAQRRQRELLADHVAGADVVITTALVPGRPAPTLIDRAHVERMRPGAVIVDLAAEAGGNCEVTEPDEIVEHHGVRIIGPTNLPAEAPVASSRMFGQNIVEILRELTTDGALRVEMDNNMIGPACVVHAGDVLHAGAREALGLAPQAASEVAP